jgi:hypothetical protein
MALRARLDPARKVCVKLSFGRVGATYGLQWPAASTLGLDVATFEIRRAEDIASAFESLKGSADALYVASDPLTNTNRVRINTLALGARLSPLAIVTTALLARSDWRSCSESWPSRGLAVAMLRKFIPFSFD